jgi:hypothetical protein
MWRVFQVGYCVYLVALIVASGCFLSIGITLALPFLLTAGLALGPISEQAGAPPTCLECGRVVLGETRAPRAVAHAA